MLAGNGFWYMIWNHLEWPRIFRWLADRNSQLNKRGKLLRMKAFQRAGSCLSCFRPFQRAIARLPSPPVAGSWWPPKTPSFWRNCGRSLVCHSSGGGWKVVETEGIWRWKHSRLVWSYLILFVCLDHISFCIPSGSALVSPLCFLPVAGRKSFSKATFTSFRPAASPAMEVERPSAAIGGALQSLEKSGGSKGEAEAEPELKLVGRSFLFVRMKSWKDGFANNI